MRHEVGSYGPRLVRTNRIAVFAAVAVCVALAAQARAQQASSPDATVPFRVGETLTYDVTWSSKLVAGSAVSMVTGQVPTSNSTVYRIVVEGRPLPVLERLYHLYYRMESLLDSMTLLPHRSSFHREEGSKKETTTTTFDRAARLASFEVQSSTEKTTLTVPQQTQDGLSAIYIVRTMLLRPGESFTLPITDDGLVYSVHAKVGPAERVVVPYGELDAWNVELSITNDQGQPAAEDAAVWITSDQRRLPVKMQASLPVGNFVLLLRSAD